MTKCLVRCKAWDPGVEDIVQKKDRSESKLKLGAPWDTSMNETFRHAQGSEFDFRHVHALRGTDPTPTAAVTYPVPVVVQRPFRLILYPVHLPFHDPAKFEPFVIDQDLQPCAFSRRPEHRDERAPNPIPVFVRVTDEQLPDGHVPRRISKTSQSCKARGGAGSDEHGLVKAHDLRTVQPQHVALNADFHAPDRLRAEAPSLACDFGPETLQL